MKPLRGDGIVWRGSGDIALRLSAAIGLSFGLFGALAAANAADCPGNPGALGTSRILKIDPREYPRIGTMQYRQSLPLEDKEVVLTFDDGPMPPYTTRVLEILAHECVKANYFVIGRMARGYPDLLRRIVTEGHVIGTHSENHPLAFDKMPAKAVQAEIERGIASTTTALGKRDAVAPFFRIPGLLRAEAVESYVQSRGLSLWSADVAADDWKHITAAEVVKRSLARLDASGKGILLLHDIQPATALALPHLLRELKRRGYRIVQVAPAVAPVPVASAAPPAARSVLQAPQAAVPPAVAPPPQATQVARTETPAPAVVTAHAATESRPQPAPPAPQPAPVTAQVQAAPATISPAAVPPAPVTTPQKVAAPVPPPARATPIAILEASRIASSTSSSSDGSAPATRPLTPGFKPSHSDSKPDKVTELRLEPRQVDVWGARAEARPDLGRPAGPLAAAGLYSSSQR